MTMMFLWFTEACSCCL